MRTLTPTPVPTPAPPAARARGGQRAGEARPRGAQPLLLVAVVLAVLLAAVAGGVLSVLELTRTPAATPGAGRQVPVSFGTAVIGDPQVVDALPAAAMKGMTHERASSDGTRRLVLPVTLVNESDAPVVYSPSAFRLTAGAAEPSPASDSPLLRGTLRPGAAVSLRLGFTVPQDAAVAALALDPARPDSTVEVALPVAAAPAQAPADPAVERSEPPAGPHTGH